MKPKTTCPVCGGQGRGPYTYQAMSKSGAYYTYTRYAHASKGSVTFCHVKVRGLANTKGAKKD
ncbi:MAG: hypothetical protein KGI38_11925 [Thaumarchaeota archaeon]|nr:hypothetical protein [Nitrososphaerota archaeon]